MFNNIGRKIKMLAKCMCWLGIIASVISGIAIISEDSYYNSTIVPGILVAVGGSFLSWIGSFFTYGFGELVENSSKRLH